MRVGVGLVGVGLVGVGLVGVGDGWVGMCVGRLVLSYHAGTPTYNMLYNCYTTLVRYTTLV